MNCCESIEDFNDSVCSTRDDMAIYLRYGGQSRFVFLQMNVLFELQKFKGSRVPYVYVSLVITSCYLPLPRKQRSDRCVSLQLCDYFGGRIIKES
jgi:hypothetical protein